MRWGYLQQPVPLFILQKTGPGHFNLSFAKGPAIQAGQSRHRVMRLRRIHLP
jgi:hypothetical protein